MQIGRPGFEKGEEERTRKNYKKEGREKWRRKKQQKQGVSTSTGDYERGEEP